MIFRPMQASDKSEMTALFAEMSEESAAFFNGDRYNETLAMRFFTEEGVPTHEFYVAADGDTVLGYVFVWDMHTSVPWFGIAVAESVRGKHFASRLVDTAKAWCVEHGKGGILLTTHMANIRAQILYENCGFEKYGIHNSGELLYLLRF